MSRSGSNANILKALEETQKSSPANALDCSSSATEVKQVCEVVRAASPIDLNQTDEFLNFSEEYDSALASRCEVPIQTIQSHLDNYAGKTKVAKANAILQELEGLINEAKVDSNEELVRVARHVSNAIKPYGSKNVTKLLGTVHSPSIATRNAKEIKEVFIDFVSAFQDFSKLSTSPGLNNKK